MLFHRGVHHHHQVVMIGGEAVHLLRVRVGRAEVAQALERVASLVVHLHLTTTGVMEDGVTMMMTGVHPAVNQARADQALANQVRVEVALHLMTMLGAGVTTTIGEALLAENLARVVAARVNLERAVARLHRLVMIGILRVLKGHGNTMNG